MINMNIIDQLKRHEGLRLKSYTCSANKVTVGYGRNIEDFGITKTEADFMLANDINRCSNEIKENIDTSHCNKARFDALVNMCFNMGITRLLEFKKTIRFIERGAFHLAAIEMIDSRWANQVKSRSAELSQQMLKGCYKDEQT